MTKQREGSAAIAEAPNTDEKSVVNKANDFALRLAKAKQAIGTTAKVVGTEKLMRQFNRTVNENIKIDKFLSGVATLPSAFRADKISAQIESLLTPKDHVHKILLAVEQQKAILDAFGDELVEMAVAEKLAWLGKFNFTEAEQELVPPAVDAYKKMLNAAVKTSQVWRRVYPKG